MEFTHTTSEFNFDLVPGELYVSRRKFGCFDSQMWSYIAKRCVLLLVAVDVEHDERAAALGFIDGPIWAVKFITHESTNITFACSKFADPRILLESRLERRSSV